VKPLVLQFQEDLAFGDKKVAELLKAAKLISVKLGLESVEDWINRELNGYDLESEKVPPYREIGGGELQFYNPYHGWLPAMGQVVLTMSVSQPVAEIEAYRGDDEFYLVPFRKYRLTDHSGDSSLVGQFPQRVAFSRSALAGILEGIKNKLLDWSIELEQRGIVGENMSFGEQEKAMAKSQIFNIEHFTGNIGDISHSKVEIYDYSSILKTLKDSGVPKAERDRLEEIMNELKAASLETKPRLVEKAKDWVVKNQDILGAAASVVMKALGQ